LIARVAARSPRIRFVDDDTALAVRVQFSALRSGDVAGELLLTGPRVKPSSRRLLARSCAEAAEAMALIIAVTLDPTSVTDHAATTTNVTASDSSQGTAPTDAPAASTATLATAGRRAETPADQPADSTSSAPTASANPPSAPAETVAAQGRVSVYLAGQSVFGPAPSVIPGISAYAMGGLDRDSLWSPAVVLGVTHAWSQGIVEWGGTAFFTLDAASLDACALRLRLAAFDVRTCGSVMIGRFSARGADTQNAPDTAVRPFAALGGSAVLTAELGWLVELSGRVAAGANLVRDSFEFAPQVFHTVEPLTVSASLGIGLRLRGR
jgi:hypothetical protein